MRMWQTENKILPGAYVNILSNAPLQVNVSERGIVALLAPISSGESVVEVTPTTDLSVLLDPSSSQDVFMRAFEGGASKIIVVNTATMTENAKVDSNGVTVTSKLEGTVGNSISVRIVKDADTSMNTIRTMVNGIEMDKQIIATTSETFENDFVKITGLKDFSELDKLFQLAGGAIKADGKTQPQLTDTLLDLNYNTLCSAKLGLQPTELDSTVLSATKAKRDEQGYTQCVVFNDGVTTYNSIGVIAVSKQVIVNDEPLDKEVMCAWVAGATAGAEINRSNTGKIFAGATGVHPSNRGQEEDIRKGLFTFKADRNQRVRVVYDINTLIEPDKDEDISFQKNRVVRVMDNIAIDMVTIWENSFMGKVNNNIDGRNLYKGALIEYFNELQRLNAIENFSASDVNVFKGKASDAVRADVHIKVVDSAEKLYLNVFVNQN